MSRPHTLTSIAEAHGVNKRAVQDWLKKARANKSTLTEDIGEMVGKTRHFSDEERDTLLQYAGETSRKAEPARVPEVLPPEAPGEYTAPVNGGSLIKRRSTAISDQFSVFDEQAAAAEMVEIQSDIDQQVQGLDGLFSGYARARVRKALVEIDHTVEALKANALADMGATTAPKQGESQGEPAVS